MPKKKETLVLLDTHAIIHRAFHALPPLTAPSGEPVQAVYGLMTMILKLVKDLAPDHIVAAYDLPGPTHRHHAYAEYKGTRKELDENLVPQIQRSRDALAALSIPIYEAPGFEADDIIGTIAEKAKSDFNIIIASGDMDTLQLIDGARVRVYTLKKGIQDTVLYDEAAVRARFGFGPEHITDYKGLAGDTSDNIIGIPGIGEKTATELIQKFGSIESMYRALDKNRNALVEKGCKERTQKLVLEHQDEAEFSKVLATIRIDAPIAFVEPKTTFVEALAVEKALAFVQDMGFRSLVPRLRDLSEKQPSSAQTAVPRPAVAPASAADQLLMDEALVMVWLLNSEATNPTEEDVWAMAKEQDIQRAHQKLLTLITKERLDTVFRDIEKPLIPVIQAMNQHGVLIDRAYLAELSVAYHRELDGLAERIYQAAGESFNINSPKQLGDILFTKLGLGGKRQKKTATGQMSTKESELLKLSGEHPIITAILEYRELNKLLGTYIDAIPPLLDQEDRLHTTFSQTGTTTGRLSSRDPNVQNIPVKTETGRRIRRAFIAPKGKMLFSSDYSQIELRLAAILSGDEKLMDIFIRGEDVHAAVASQVFGVSQESVTKEMRRRAKVINFGILYGMGVNALREQLGTDRAEAQAFLNKYFETFATLAAYLDKTKASAERTGYTTTLFGRKRYFPGLTSKLPFIRAAAERMAINAPLQGTQSDIIKIAMSRIHHLFETAYKGRAALVLQIHDELIMEVDEDLVQEISTKTKAIMERVLTTADTNGVPITVSAEAGPSWGEMKSL